MVTGKSKQQDDFQYSFIVQTEYELVDNRKGVTSDLPEYIVHGEDIMVKFAALQSAKVIDTKAPKGHAEPLKEPIEEPLKEKIISILKKAPDSTYDSLAGELGISRSTVKRSFKILIESGQIDRVGGRRYGHWEIHE